MMVIATPNQIAAADSRQGFLGFLTFSDIFVIAAPPSRWAFRLRDLRAASTTPGVAARDPDVRSVDSGNKENNIPQKQPRMGPRAQERPASLSTVTMSHGQ